ncbi:MAG: S1/P1 nuclease [Bacterioplanes sp.]|nr:S1/P1 nuclease [Bacterioplanes sp.]
MRKNGINSICNEFISCLWAGSGSLGRFVGLLLVLCLPVQSVYGFDGRTHALICDMAYERLSAKAQQRVQQLVKQSGKKHFAQACAWPDEVRRQARFSHTRPWHFVNVARGASTVKASDCEQQGCVVTAIQIMEKRLAAKPNDDWQALLFLAHFIADVHQPLHVSYANDLGGNRASVRYHGRPSNLHRLWDGQLMPKEQFHVTRQRLVRGIAGNPAHWRQGDEWRWANESLTITRQLYRQHRDGQVIDAVYLAKYRPVFEQRVQQAAVRLAWRLERLLG